MKVKYIMFTIKQGKEKQLHFREISASHFSLHTYPQIYTLPKQFSKLVQSVPLLRLLFVINLFATFRE